MFTHAKGPAKSPSDAVASAREADIRRQAQIAWTLQGRWTPTWGNRKLGVVGHDPEVYFRSGEKKEAESAPEKVTAAENGLWPTSPTDASEQKAAALATPVQTVPAHVAGAGPTSAVKSAQVQRQRGPCEDEQKKRDEEMATGESEPRAQLLSAPPAHGPSFPARLLGRTSQQAPRLRIQREPEPGAATPGPPTALDRLVDAPSENGDLGKADFLDALEDAVRSQADAALVGTKYTTDNCPWIVSWFAYYRSTSAAHLRQVIQRYAPAAAAAGDREGLVAALAARVREGVEKWVKTGQIDAPALPAGEGPIDAPAPTAQEDAAPTVPPPGGIQTKSGGAPATPRAADPVAVQAQLGGGLPLDPVTRGRMESAAGHAFSDVRIHADATGAAVASAFEAQAVTVGNHIAFTWGAWQPGSPVGDALLAHELAHVQQQHAATPGATSRVVELPGGPLEQAADQQAMAMLASLWADVPTRPRAAVPSRGLRLSRCAQSRQLSEAEQKEYWKEGVEQQYKGKLQSQDATPISDLRALEDRARDELAGAVKAGALPATLFNAWYAAHTALIPLVPSAKAGNVDSTMRALAASALKTFYDELRKAVGPSDKKAGTVMMGKFSSREVFDNPYFSPDAALNAGDRLKKASTGAEWLTAFSDFKETSLGLFKYAAAQTRAAAGNAEAADLKGARDAALKALADNKDSLVKGSADTSVVSSTTNTIGDFLDKFRAAAGPSEYETRTIGKFSQTTTVSSFSLADYEQAKRLLDSARADKSKWEAVDVSVRAIANNVEKYLVDPQRKVRSEAADRLEYAGGLASDLEQILREHPDAKKVRAIFYPEEESKRVGAAGYAPTSGIPLYFYVWKDGSSWRLQDITTPQREKVNSAKDLNGQPDFDDLLSQLDTKLRFPKGFIKVQAPDGSYFSRQTTEPWSVSEWATKIGLGLLALGVILGTAGMGTLATISMVAASAAGAVGSVADMAEKSRAGVLTAADVVVDVGQLLADVAGASAIVSGRVLRSMVLEGTILSARMAKMTQAVFVQATKVQLVANATTLLIMDAQTLSAINAVDKAGGDAKDREMAKMRLATSFLLSNAIFAFSINGDLAELGGPKLYIDKDFGRNVVARGLREDADLVDAIQKTNKGAGASLQRLLATPNLSDELKNRVRAEVNYALSKGNVDRSTLDAIIGRLDSAASDATKLAQELAELRYANRVTSQKQANTGQVLVGVKGEVEVAGQKVDLGGIPEADAVYKGTSDGKIHVDEVKNTAHALREKLLKHPDQLERMAEWRASSAGDRDIGVHLETEENWTELFGKSRGERDAAMQVLMDKKIPLTIGARRLDPPSMEKLWNAVRAKATEQGLYGKKGADWGPFYAKMSTIEDAEKFLGIKL